MLSNFKKKQKRSIFQKHFLIKFAGIMFLAIAVLIVFADIKIYRNRKKLEAQLNDYKKQIEEIEKRNQDLEEGIVKADDKDYIEKVAREEFGMQQEGEKVVAFVLPEQKKEEIETEPKENIFSISSWLGRLNRSWQMIKTNFKPK